MSKHFMTKKLLFRPLTLFMLMLFISFSPVSFGTGSNDIVLDNTTSVVETASNDGNSQNEHVVDIPGNGTKVQVQAGDLTRLRLRDQLQVNLSLQEHAELNVCICDNNPAGPLPANTFRFRNFYQFDLNTSTGLQATFQMGFDNANLPIGVTPEMLSWAYFNTNTNQWQYVNSWLNEEKNMIMTQTNHFSTWTVLVSEQDNKPNEPKKNDVNEITANGSAWKMENGNIYRFRTQYGFELNVSIGEPAELKLNESIMTQNQYQYMNSNQHSIGKVIQLELNKTGISIEATLAYKIASEDVPANVDPFQLQFAYLDEVNNQWKIQNSWVEDIGSGYYMVYANTTHFSTWSVLATEKTSSTTTGVAGFEFLPILGLLLIPIIRKKN